MLGDADKCVNQDPNVVFTSLVHSSTEVQHEWLIALSPDGQVVPNQQQLGSNYTTLHNQIQDFSKLNESHHEDPYLVHVKRKLSSSINPTYTNCVICFMGLNLTCKRPRVDERVLECYMEFSQALYKVFLVLANVLVQEHHEVVQATCDVAGAHSSRSHIAWSTTFSQDLRTNPFQEEGNDTNEQASKGGLGLD